MSIKEWWRKLNYWKKGGIIGFLIGLLKIPFFISLGEDVPEFIGNIFFKIPDYAICNLLSFDLGEQCGFFALVYGFFYNPLFYGIIGIVIGISINKFKRK